VFGDARELTEILDMKDDVVDEPGAKKLVINKAKINFSDITFKHKDAKEPIFKNYSLAIAPGERVGLVGVSGSGKTTLTKLLLRFADVDAGKIMIDDQNVRNVTQQSLREAIAYVPQESSLFHRTVFDNIAYGPRCQGIKNKKELNGIVIDSLKKAAIYDEVKDRLKDSALSLSGGQQQRLCIARCIAMKPDVILMDEPTSALDPIATLKVEELIDELKKEYTIIIVTHNMQQATRISDYTAFFMLGEIVEYAETDELFKNPKCEKTKDYITGRFG
jgi:phosphate transport system ATP-binding protein